MKNTVLFLFAVAILASCKKTYNCKCTTVTTRPAGSMAPNTTSDATLTSEKKKKEAEDWCNGFESTDQSTSAAGTTSIVTSCELQ